MILLKDLKDTLSKEEYKVLNAIVDLYYNPDAFCEYSSFDNFKIFYISGYIIILGSIEKKKI